VPTATPTFSPASNWNQLSNKCGTSACSIANGGCTIILSDDFSMGSYSGEIYFSGKAIIIWGQGKVLDASGGGRFFIGQGAGSFLELHDAVLQNGYAVHGGAIKASNGANVKIYTSIFESNIANDAGGAIFAYGANVEIYTSTFESNSALNGWQQGGRICGSQADSDDNCGGDGGAIYTYGADVKIYTSTFDSNSADESVDEYGGGGRYCCLRWFQCGDP
jgi:hypothetical protein